MSLNHLWLALALAATLSACGDREGDHNQNDGDRRTIKVKVRATSM